MTDAPTTRETADHAELMDRIREVVDDCRCAEDGGIILGGSVAREHAADLENLLSEIAALRGELHSEERFMRSYPEAVRKGHWESVARLLSGRLREMDKRAKAANIARTQAERQRDEAVEYVARLLDAADEKVTDARARIIRSEARAFLANQGADQ